MNIVTYAIPIFLVLMVIEALYSHYAKKNYYETKDTWASLLAGVISTLVSIATKFVIIGIFFVLYEITPLKVGNDWYTWILNFLLIDFCFYWAHRYGHECRIGWAAHIPHHNSQFYNFSTALRQSCTHHYFAVFSMIIPLLGFNPVQTLIVHGINTVYQFWIHTRIIKSLGPLEWILNTPSHHRVHHGSNPEYIDKNYAGALIIWDRIFGTFTPETKPVVYGITKNIESYSPITINFHEYVDIFRDMAKTKSWVNKLKHLFYLPAWQPDNQTKNQSNT